MFWNHRVLLHTGADDNWNWLAIHEVFYDDDGNPEACSQTPIHVIGDTLVELGETLDRMKACLNRPILDYESFGTKTITTAEKSTIFLEP